MNSFIHMFRYYIINLKIITQDIYISVSVIYIKSFILIMLF